MQICNYSVSAEYSVRYSAEYFGRNRFRSDSFLMPKGRLSLATVSREDQRQTRTNAITSQLIWSEIHASLFVGFPLEPGRLVTLEVSPFPRGLLLGGLSVASRRTLLLLEPNLETEVQSAPSGQFQGFVKMFSWQFHRPVGWYCCAARQGNNCYRNLHPVCFIRDGL